jgi:hypothetical protein
MSTINNFYDCLISEFVGLSNLDGAVVPNRFDDEGNAHGPCRYEVASNDILKAIFSHSVNENVYQNTTLFVQMKQMHQPFIRTKASWGKFWKMLYSWFFLGGGCKLVCSIKYNV